MLYSQRFDNITGDLRTIIVWKTVVPADSITIYSMLSNSSGLSQQRWVFLLLILITAGALRLWQLDAVPPGLYRDEAYNGLDALGVLDGDRPLYFENNNGREPLYVYITSVSVWLFGRSVWAVRLGAAVVGTLTTLIIYKWATAWFDEQIGLLTAWFWAVTVWPIHLSRIGFRVVTLVPFLALAAWLGTVAYRRQKVVWWFAAGLAYGLSYYSYLAVRFTPVLLVAFVLYLWWQKRHRPLIKGLPWLGLGLGLALLPLLWVGWQQPELFLGRTGQVSILSEDINNGDLWGTLISHIGRSLGLFFWAGDEIIRHNPAGRPLFDPLIAVPFVIGVGWCVAHWRQSAAMGVLVWTAVMLGPTILAEDAPHFLRAVGILPATLIFPAIGLSWLLSSPTLEGSWRKAGLTTLILVASLGFTIHDYFSVYAQDEDTAYLFEAAARQLADSLKSEQNPSTVVWDRDRYWSNWPSIRFLWDLEGVPYSYDNFAAETEEIGVAPSVWYLWPYERERLAFVVQQIEAPAVISAEVGPLARGDLEPEAYPFYVRYEVSERMGLKLEESIRFNNQYELHVPADVTVDTESQTVMVDLYWSSALAAENRPPVTVFVHVLDTESGILSGQSDTIPAQGYLPSEWWSADVIVHDRHEIVLTAPFNPDRHHILVGLYPVGQPNQRLPIVDDAGQPARDSWRVTP